jgi:diguanylate cyclase
MPFVGRHETAPTAEESAAAEQPKDLPDSWSATTAVELIARLIELTTTVSSEVEQHSDHIESINAELSDVKHGDTAAVAAVVCKLLVMNQETQRRLERAELKLQAQQRQLQDVSTAARMDGLTGLVNRRSLDEALRRCVADFERKGRPATLLMLDVDHFKLFNDAHGHIAGDDALKNLADLIASQSRETDVVARFGGEEFVVVFTGASLGAVKQRAEKLRQSILAKPVLTGNSTLHISASAGLAELQQGDDEREWIKRADTALYAAKANNRNCLYWHDGNQPLCYLASPAAASVETEKPRTDDRRQIATELASDAFGDPTFVTSLSRRVAEWRRGGAPFSVILARLDGMEQIIADHRAEARQTALKALTQLTHASIRDMDLPTRWMSDGIAIFLPSARIYDATGVARRLLDALERCQLPLPGGGLRLSLSIGVAEVIDGNDAQRLLERALLALDAARQGGGARVCLHDGLQTMPGPVHHLAGALGSI